MGSVKAFAYNPVGNESYSIPPNYGLISRYDFHEGSGTTLHDVFGPNDLTINAGCTWVQGSNGGSQGLMMAVSNTCGINYPDAQFNVAKTICIVGTMQTTAVNYKAILSNTSNGWYLWNNGYDQTIVNFGSGSMTNQVLSIPVTGSIHISPGQTQMLCWVRDATADRIYFGPSQTVAYSSQSGSAGYTATGSTMQFGNDRRFSTNGFDETFFEILTFSQELTSAQIARVNRAERRIQFAKALSTGGGGVMNAIRQVAVLGASIWAGSTLPTPGSPNLTTWNVATMITPGNTTAAGVSQPNNTLINLTATFNNAEGSTIGSVEAGFAVGFYQGNTYALQNYRIEADRSALVDVLEVANSIGPMTLTQLIATHSQMLGFLSPYMDIVSLTNPLTLTTQSGSANTYLLSYNSDVLTNSISYGGTSTFDLYNQPNAQNLSMIYRWDSVHFNQFGQCTIIMPGTIAALNQMYIY